MRYSAQRQVSHDLACHGVVGQYCGGIQFPILRFLIGGQSPAENLTRKGEVDI